MKFGGRSERTAGDMSADAISKEDLFAGAFEVTRIPFKIEDEIMIRSQTMPAHRAKTTIVGAVHGDFILIREPLVVVNNRLLAIFDGGIEASYFTEGYRYNFFTRYRGHTLNDIVCISYPQKALVKQIRKHRRIRVNIEMKYAMIGTANWLSGDILDISQGGCRVVTKSKGAVTKGMKALLVFSLPNESEINDLRAEVVRCRPIQNDEATEVGFSFSGPPNELAKINSFCEFCLFFELD
jgi:c-di-GMP-binding flagellar brake protein YcgR